MIKMVRPLAYNSGLSYEDAEKNMEVGSEFVFVKTPYYGFFGRG